LIKAKKKEKKQKSKTCHAHLLRFKEEMREDEGKLSKKEKQALFKELCLKGPKYIIDCEFDALMVDRELKSLGQ
jgi:hypothetical protein